jgi:aspartate/methionine/tyrosine aminotransferase
MKRMNDLFAATPTYPGELLSMAVLGQMDRLRKRALSVVEADRKTLTEFLDAHPEIGVTRTPYGTTAFLKLPVASVEEFLGRLRNEYETSAVPGRFFEMPEWVRIGMGVDHAMFEEGLRRMGRALRG